MLDPGHFSGKKIIKDENAACTAGCVPVHHHLRFDETRWPIVIVVIALSRVSLHTCSISATQAGTISAKTATKISWKRRVSSNTTSAVPPITTAQTVICTLTIKMSSSTIIARKTVMPIATGATRYCGANGDSMTITKVATTPVSYVTACFAPRTNLGII